MKKMSLNKSLIALSISALFLAGCAQKDAVSSANAIEKDPTKVEVVAQTESAKANKMFDDAFKANIDRSPMMQTYLGIKKDYDKWNDISEENTAKELAITKTQLESLKTIDKSKLDAQTLISYRLAEQRLQNTIDDHKWRFHNYPVNQMFGLHSQIPAFLINQHSITSVDDANAYISRVERSQKLLEQLIDGLKLREDKGIIAPKFVFEHVIRDSKNLLNGAPFDTNGESTVLADFAKKVDKLEIADEEK